MSSNAKVEVVSVELKKHPNADSLSIVELFDGGFTVCVRTEDWIGKTKGAYICPDSVVDSSRAEFEFLKGHERIKVKKLRGVLSMGLLMPVDNSVDVGVDLAEAWNVIRYEPKIHQGKFKTSTEAEKGPYVSKYDLDNLRRYPNVFVENERILVTEKIHGTNTKYTYQESRMFAGSRNEWKKPNPNSIYWKILEIYKGIEEYCRDHEGDIVFGEIFGWVQDLRYGAKTPDDLYFRCFDIMSNNRFLDFDEAHSAIEDYLFSWVPILDYDIPYNFKKCEELSIGGTCFDAEHVREGIVIRPLKERFDPKIGRVCLKLVSNDYLERSK